MFEAISEDPPKAWSMILDLIDVASDEDALMRIGIGPFADFIAENGSAFIDTIIETARRNPPVRKTLQYASDFPHEPIEVERRIRELVGPVDPDPVKRETKAATGPRPKKSSRRKPAPKKRDRRTL